MENRAKGVACLLLSAFGFALMVALVRLADDLGAPLPTPQKALFRNLVAFAVAAAVFWRRRAAGADVDARRLTARNWRDLLLRATFGTLGVFANFYAVSHAPVADAMALNKTAPLFTVVASWVLLGEATSPRQTLCLLGAAAGAALVVKPGLGGSAGALSVGLLGGLCAGLAYAWLHLLGRRGVDGAFIVLFFSAFSCLACAPFLVFDYHAMNAAQTLALCGAGAGAALGQFGVTWAYRFAEPRQIAAYDYFGVLFAALFGFALFGQIPDLWSCAGFALIALSALRVQRRKARDEKCRGSEDVEVDGARNPTETHGREER